MEIATARHNATSSNMTTDLAIIPQDEDDTSTYSWLYVFIRILICVLVVALYTWLYPKWTRYVRDYDARKRQQMRIHQARPKSERIRKPRHRYIRRKRIEKMEEDEEPLGSYAIVPLAVPASGLVKL